MFDHLKFGVSDYAATKAFFVKDVAVIAFNRPARRFPCRFTAAVTAEASALPPK